MTTIRTLRRNVVSAAAALAMSAILITAAAGPVGSPADAPAAQRVA